MDNLKLNILNIAHDNYQYLMNLENVIGVGLGYKCIKGIYTVEPCIHVLVENKIDSKYITKNNLVPKTYMGIKTDVFGVGKVENHSPDSIITSFRPLEGGCSIMAGNKVTGTLGCIVKKTSKGKIKFYILSNNHVLANVNSFSIGTPIIQPSIKFGGNPIYDKVAVLSQYIPVKFTTRFSKPINYVDCAIARILYPSNISARVKHLGILRGTAAPTLMEDVSKVGMSSGLTKGFISTLGTTLTVSAGKKSIFYQDQIRALLNSERGDSGSVIVNKDNKVVGLLVSGSEAGETFFNDINEVLKRLKVEIFAINKNE